MTSPEDGGKKAVGAMGMRGKLEVGAAELRVDRVDDRLVLFTAEGAGGEDQPAPWLEQRKADLTEGAAGDGMARKGRRVDSPAKIRAASERAEL